MKKNTIIVLILGVFSVLCTELGVVGILPAISDTFQISIAKAGMLISMFALVVAISALTMPLILSRVNRKIVMLVSLSVFTICDLCSAFAASFSALLALRMIAAIFQPVYVSMAFTIAGASVRKEDVPKATAKVMMGVSAAMVLGGPVAALIVNLASLRMGYCFFALLNAVALVTTLICVPTMPVSNKLSYGSQIRILKRFLTWVSIVGIICFNAAVMGVYSYLSEYVVKVTGLPAHWISILLMIYGVANVVGNAVAGRMLSSKPFSFVLITPTLLGVVYLLLLFFGHFTLPLVLITLAWGVLGGCAGIIYQYWISSAAPDAPDFANGVFLASGNVGVMVGTAACGLVISKMGLAFKPFSGIIFLILTLLAFMLRINYQKEPSCQKQLDLE